MNFHLDLMPALAYDSTVRGGVIAVGDSIQNGNGPDLDGMPCRPWGQWLADELGLPFESVAVGGARARQIAAGQLFRLEGRYEIGLLNMGTNDAFRRFRRRQVRRAAKEAGAALAERCERLVVLGVLWPHPLIFRFPHRANAVNAELTAVAVRHGGVFVAPRLELALLKPDRIHPNALGNREIARQVLAALR